MSTLAHVPTQSNVIEYGESDADVGEREWYFKAADADKQDRQEPHSFKEVSHGRRAAARSPGMSSYRRPAAGAAPAGGAKYGVVTSSGGYGPLSPLGRAYDLSTAPTHYTGGATRLVSSTGVPRRYQLYSRSDVPAGHANFDVVRRPANARLDAARYRQNRHSWAAGTSLSRSTTVASVGDLRWRSGRADAESPSGRADSPTPVGRRDSLRVCERKEAPVDAGGADSSVVSRRDSLRVCERREAPVDAGGADSSVVSRRDSLRVCERREAPVDAGGADSSVVSRRDSLRVCERREPPSDAREADSSVVSRRDSLRAGERRGAPAGAEPAESPESTVRSTVERVDSVAQAGRAGSRTPAGRAGDGDPATVRGAAGTSSHVIKPGASSPEEQRGHRASPTTQQRANKADVPTAKAKGSQEPKGTRIVQKTGAQQGPRQLQGGTSPTPAVRITQTNMGHRPSEVTHRAKDNSVVAKPGGGSSPQREENIKACVTKSQAPQPSGSVQQPTGSHCQRGPQEIKITSTSSKPSAQAPQKTNDGPSSPPKLEGRALQPQNGNVSKTKTIAEAQPSTKETLSSTNSHAKTSKQPDDPPHSNSTSDTAQQKPQDKQVSPKLITPHGLKGIPCPKPAIKIGTQTNTECGSLISNTGTSIRKDDLPLEPKPLPPEDKYKQSSRPSDNQKQAPSKLASSNNGAGVPAQNGALLMSGAASSETQRSPISTAPHTESSRGDGSVTPGSPKLLLMEHVDSSENYAKETQITTSVDAKPKDVKLSEAKRQAPAPENSGTKPALTRSCSPDPAQSSATESSDTASSSSGSADSEDTSSSASEATSSESEGQRDVQQAESEVAAASRVQSDRVKRMAPESTSSENTGSEDSDETESGSDSMSSAVGELCDEIAIPKTITAFPEPQKKTQTWSQAELGSVRLSPVAGLESSSSFSKPVEAVPVEPMKSTSPSLRPTKPQDDEQSSSDSVSESSDSSESFPVQRKMVEPPARSNEANIAQKTAAGSASTQPASHGEETQMPQPVPSCEPCQVQKPPARGMIKPASMPSTSMESGENETTESSESSSWESTESSESKRRSSDSSCASWSESHDAEPNESESSSSGSVESKEESELSPTEDAPLRPEVASPGCKPVRDAPEVAEPAPWTIPSAQEIISLEPSSFPPGSTIPEPELVAPDSDSSITVSNLITTESETPSFPSSCHTSKSPHVCSRSEASVPESESLSSISEPVSSESESLSSDSSSSTPSTQPNVPAVTSHTATVKTPEEHPHATDPTASAHEDLAPDCTIQPSSEETARRLVVAPQTPPITLPSLSEASHPPEISHPPVIECSGPLWPKTRPDPELPPSPEDTPASESSSSLPSPAPSAQNTGDAAPEAAPLARPAPPRHRHR
ncbi:dentin sialophosphoprotein-like, partial [Pollicipes pollicipes]|uniref:dentin sialophosphoprotein-like n=1 Tax=Pollicipes pollicipes TaxID=41117 RepID=UPI0018857DCE